MSTKRKSGQLKDGKYLVLTESEGKQGVGFTHSCGTEIMGAKVAHPVWDGPFPMSGSGQVKYTTVPYCTKCETTPDFHGMPVEVGPKI